MIDKDFYDNLPKKRMGAGVLFFNEKDELLIIKPNYKDHWTIPGGVVDANESPRQAAIREVKEELGLDIDPLKLLCVNYVPDHDEKGESLQLVFYGGILNSEKIGSFKIPNKEIDGHKFIKAEELMDLLEDRLRWRISKCLEALKDGTAIYLDDER